MRILLLNNNYQFLDIVSWKKATSLMCREKVDVVKYSDKIIRTVSSEFKIPKIIRLVYMVKQLYRKVVTYKKKLVLERDNYICVYCGKQNHSMTVDHILPKSRGGKNTYMNTITSCKVCNHHKGNRTPTEANMKMLYEPKSISMTDILNKRLKSAGLSMKTIWEEM